MLGVRVWFEDIFLNILKEKKKKERIYYLRIGKIEEFEMLELYGF